MNAENSSGERVERCSVVVVTRDRFSTSRRCLDEILANTLQPHDLIFVAGGVPERLKKEFRHRYGDRVRFCFTDHFLNPAQARNIGLKACRTRLAVLMDNDVYVRPGWLGSLLNCQQETGAAMVVPVILEAPKVIHCAGNDLLVTHEGGKAWAGKVLRYMKKTYCEDSNLKRVTTDYGELHCQLVVVKTALELGVYDEQMREAGECDAGLTWQKAGCGMWFEPSSVVRYDIPNRVTHVEDIPFFIFKWDMRAIKSGYDYFEKKWGLDITEYGQFKFFLLEFNSRVGSLSRTFPCALTLAMNNWLLACREAVQKSLKLWMRVRAGLLGFYEW